MTNIKRYEINYDNKASVIVDVDHDIVTDESLTEINDFWFGSDDRLEAANGSVLKSVLILLGCKAIMTNLLGTADACDMFKTDPPEGWPKLDGNMGITIIKCDYYEFDDFDFSITEVPIKEKI